MWTPKRHSSKDFLASCLLESRLHKSLMTPHTTVVFDRAGVFFSPQGATKRIDLPRRTSVIDIPGPRQPSHIWRGDTFCFAPHQMEVRIDYSKELLVVL